jgi:hypothetical protein
MGGLSTIFRRLSQCGKNCNVEKMQVREMARRGTDAAAAAWGLGIAWLRGGIRGARQKSLENGKAV